MYTVIFTITFLCNLLIIILWSLSKNNKFIKQIGVSTLVLIFAFVLMGLLFPIEFVFTKTIASKRILPYLFNILKTSIISYKVVSINLFQILFIFFNIGTLIYLIKSSLIYTKF